MRQSYANLRVNTEIVPRLGSGRPTNAASVTKDSIRGSGSTLKMEFLCMQCAPKRRPSSKANLGTSSASTRSFPHKDS